MLNYPGLSWRCSECDRKCFTIDQAGLNTFLEQKHSEILGSLSSVFDNLKCDFSKITEEKFKLSQHPVQSVSKTYSESLKNKTEPAVLIKPNNIVQTVALNLT
jgi:hypothetical protein